MNRTTWPPPEPTQTGLGSSVSDATPQSGTDTPRNRKRAHSAPIHRFVVAIPSTEPDPDKLRRRLENEVRYICPDATVTPRPSVRPDR